MYIFILYLNIMEKENILSMRIHYITCIYLLCLFNSRYDRSIWSLDALEY